MFKDKKYLNLIRFALPLVLTPVVIALGVFVFREKFYAWISLVIALLAVLFLITCFENKKSSRRKIALISVLTSLAIVSRFIPVLKPVTAIIILSAVYLGPEAGFLIGAMTAVVSNFFFGQGPWTPFQMFALGLIGLVAGLLGRFLTKRKLALALYGALAGVMYSFIMDIWTVLWYNTFSWELYLGAITTAIPYTISYMISNVLFLLLLAKPIGSKLERIRTKYGIV